MTAEEWECSKGAATKCVSCKQKQRSDRQKFFSFCVEFSRGHQTILGLPLTHMDSYYQAYYR